MTTDTRGVLGIHDDGAVRVITLDRQDSLNAFNQDLWHATSDALEDAAADDAVTCAVLTGSGRAFTAGQDLTEMSDPSLIAQSGEEVGYARFMPVIESFPKPLLAAVNGIGVGIGLTVLMHCDIALIAPDARLKAPFASLGVTTEAAASYLLPQTAGWQEAAWILFTEPWIDAETAVRLGLAWRVADDDVLEETLAVARRIAELPLDPLMTTKRLMVAARGDAVASARTRELAEFERLVGAMVAAGTPDD